MRSLPQSIKEYKIPSYSLMYDVMCTLSALKISISLLLSIIWKKSRIILFLRPKLKNKEILSFFIILKDFVHFEKQS